MATISYVLSSNSLTNIRDNRTAWGKGLSYKNNWEQEGIYIELSGILTEADFYDSNMEIYDDERFQHCRYQLVDALKVEEVQASVEAMEVVIGMDQVASSYTHNMKIAFVTKNHQLRKIFSMYVNALICAKWQSMLTDNLEQARQWINNPD